MHGLEPHRFRSVITTALPHPLLFASVSGAHLYGFPSPDSDVDLRGCHMLPARALLGLHPPKPTLNRTWIVDGVEIDLVSHDLVKYVVLLLQPHGNYLEQLFSPLVVLDTPWAEELRSLARLHDDLAAARDASPLPEEPPNQAALDDFVVRVRLAEGL